MRITFDASTAETCEYLRTVTAVLKHNQEVSDEVKAFNSLKELVLSIDHRLSTIESERRNKVCR